METKPYWERLMEALTNQYLPLTARALIYTALQVELDLAGDNYELWE